MEWAGEAVTVSFLTLAFAQLWHVYNMRDRCARLLRNDITQNATLWVALGLCVVLLLLAVNLPLLREVLGIEAIDWRGWALILGMSLVPVLLGGLARLLRGSQDPEHRARGEAPVNPQLA